MAGIRSTTVWAEYVDHDTGHWCNTCRLSTGLRLWVMVSHLGRAHLQTRLVCTECEGHDVTADPDVVIS